LAARIVREVAGLTRRAEQQDKRLAVLAIDTQIRFARQRIGPRSPAS